MPEPVIQPDQFKSYPPQLNTPDSMKAILLQPLTELQSLSQTLFLSLSPPQSKPPPAPPVSAFLSCDAALANAIQLARVHQDKQRKIENLKNDMLELEARWKDICRELADSKRELEEMIKEGEKRCRAIEEAKKGLQIPPYLTVHHSNIAV